MSDIRFLFDENMPHAVSDQLIRREPAIQLLSVGIVPAPELGTLDPEILIWLEAEQYHLVTRNRRSMPVHLEDHLASGRHVPGILTVRPRASMGQVIDDLLLIWTLAEPGEHRDQIVHLPL